MATLLWILAVVGAPDPQHVGGGAQDQPAHRQTQVLGAGVEVQLAGLQRIGELVGAGTPRPEPLHRLAADQLVVQVPVGGRVPAVPRVDRRTDHDPGRQRLVDREQQRTQPRGHGSR